MNENNPNEESLLLREVLNEYLIQDMILFIITLLFIISQEWNNILLLIFPIICFTFSIFFKIIATNRYRLIQISNISYYPLGSEKRYSNRLFFASMFLSIFILWMGFESYLTPQLIDNFFFLFSIIFILIYTFSFLWIFIDIWKYAKIKIKFENKIITFSALNNKTYLSIFLSEIIVFLSLNLLNFLFTLSPNSSFLSIFPGLESEEIMFTYLYGLYLTILIITPITAIINLTIIYKYLHYHDPEHIKAKFETYPKEVREQIIQQLNQKFKKIIYDEDLE